MCVILFLIITEHESSEFFHNFSKKEKYRFSLNRKSTLCISAKNGSLLSVLICKVFLQRKIRSLYSVRCNISWLLETISQKNRKGNFFLSSMLKEAIVDWSLEDCLNFMITSSRLIFRVYFASNSGPSIVFFNVGYSEKKSGNILIWFNWQLTFHNTETYRLIGI